MVEYNTRNRIYTDIDMDMGIHPHTNDVVTRSNENAISGSIMNIIKTRKGERVFNPSFGSTVYSSLFEPMSEMAKLALKSQIESAINNQEPRAALDSVHILADEIENGYEITIIYSPLNENKVVELEFFLKRLR